MAAKEPQAREDQFLGSLLGLAIGDAMGRPLRGLTADEIAIRYGTVDSFIPAGEKDGDVPEAGEISDKTEVALCIVESLTTNDGLVDPVNINARLGFLAAGPSRAWMSDASAEGIALAADHDGLVPDSYAPEPELSVAVRGVPIGLIHAVGGYDPAILANEAALVSRFSHAGASQAVLTATVARAVAGAARTRAVDASIAPAGDSQAFGQVRELLAIAARAEAFDETVARGIGLGGDTDSLGAVAGAIAGARFGASGIPQHLIDDLDARIYLTLAAPWFYRTAVRRAGTVIDLRVIP